MEKQGVVSIWLGTFASTQLLDEYTFISYDEEDDIKAPFFQDFRIDLLDVDDDFMEKEKIEKPSSSLSELLEGVSYDDIIVPQLNSTHLKRSYNTIILLYNYDYKERLRSVGNVDFIAAVHYK
ncbi:immunity 22 family protein [Priestia koreensis]|uniref:immunity 22 family protein n=2 Tax=Priestia koreensis TaxID=284581 RepID=UPI001F59B743|nr:immunity 22 family protein [Priestia koreensis]UNL86811.1 immunity 22 family protein [Priestia koreensis]